MKAIDKQYITNEKNERIAVQVEIKTFEKMEQLLEDYALGKYLDEDDSEKLTAEEAKTYYNQLKKAD
ncbi:MAG: hypothetical protein KDC79_08305 [Cyclobacteriaceae bacterium]|nr:hypothetical protein [Cyclobacteriaceae bacterium]